MAKRTDRRPRDCVVCGVTFPSFTSRQIRCSDCQYRFTLDIHTEYKLRAGYTKGPRTFNCYVCGISVTNRNAIQKCCPDCMRTNELRTNYLRWLRKHERRIRRTTQCDDCGALIYDATPAQKRCPGCQFLRSYGVRENSWRPLRKTGKPINCSECQAPVIKYHPNRTLCDQCYRKARAAKSLATFREHMRDPAFAGRIDAMREAARRRLRAARRQIAKDPVRLEQAVAQRINQLIGGNYEHGKP